MTPRGYTELFQALPGRDTQPPLFRGDQGRGQAAQTQRRQHSIQTDQTHRRRKTWQNADQEDKGSGGSVFWGR